MTISAGSETGRFCESCGMPMRMPDDFGTSSDGARSNEYCRFCFVHGHFTEPDLTMQAMIEKCAGHLACHGAVSKPQARMLMAETIPRLKRWCRAMEAE